jgi:hypothetical protein
MYIILSKNKSRLIKSCCERMIHDGEQDFVFAAIARLSKKRVGEGDMCEIVRLN